MTTSAHTQMNRKTHNNRPIYRKKTWPQLTPLIATKIEDSSLKQTVSSDPKQKTSPTSSLNHLKLNKKLKNMYLQHQPHKQTT